MLLSSCQKWVWNWFWVSINFTLCSLWEVFHLFKLRKILFFSNDVSVRPRGSLGWPASLRCLLYRSRKLSDSLPWTLLKLVKTHSSWCSFKGFLPLLITEVLSKSMHLLRSTPDWSGLALSQCLAYGGCLGIILSHPLYFPGLYQT